jgi:hypothetical protein
MSIAATSNSEESQEMFIAIEGVTTLKSKSEVRSSCFEIIYVLMFTNDRDAGLPQGPPSSVGQSAKAKFCWPTPGIFLLCATRRQAPDQAHNLHQPLQPTHNSHYPGSQASLQLHTRKTHNLHAPPSAPPQPAMASDEIVWKIINNQFCSFKLKLPQRAQRHRPL